MSRFSRSVWLTRPEHAKQGVRCVAFHPGGIAETGMGQTAPEQFRSRLYDTGKDSRFSPFSYPFSPVLFLSLIPPNAHSLTCV